MMMMLPVMQRRIIVMVVIRTPRLRMVHSGIRHAAMLQRHMPGGKEPAKQRQQGKDVMKWAHTAPYRRGDATCQLGSSDRLRTEGRHEIVSAPRGGESGALLIWASHRSVAKVTHNGHAT